MAVSPPTQNVEADDLPVPLGFRPEHVYASEMQEKTVHNIKFDRIEFVVHDIRFQKHDSDTIQSKKYIITIYKTPIERYISQVSQPNNTI